MTAVSEGIVNEVRREGIAVLPWAMPSPHVDAFNSYLAVKEIWEGHVRSKSGGRRGDPSSSASTSWSMDDVVLAPHFLEFALDLFPVVQELLSGRALLYSLNVFTTYPRSGPTIFDVQEFHRDFDDSDFVGLFILCSDVPCIEEGAHQFVKGSQSDDQQRGLDGREVYSVTGKAGTAFLAVTRGLHRGVRPLSRPRTLAWARWGVSDPPAAYGWDGLSPVSSTLLGTRYPSDPDMRRSLRLVISE